MAGLTISEAATAWGVHRDTVKRWVKLGHVEGAKDNRGVWRVGEGQQPPPEAGGGRHRGIPGESPRRADRMQFGGVPSATPVVPHEAPGNALADHVAELTEALAEAGNHMATAERDLAVANREVELLRERAGEFREALARAEAERGRLEEMLLALLHRPSFMDRLLGALGSLRKGGRVPGGNTKAE